jgi:hypothetical protein
MERDPPSGASINLHSRGSPGLYKHGIPDQGVLLIRNPCYVLYQRAVEIQNPTRADQSGSSKKLQGIFVLELITSYIVHLFVCPIFPVLKSEVSLKPLSKVKRQNCVVQTISHCGIEGYCIACVAICVVELLERLSESVFDY